MSSLDLHYPPRRWWQTGVAKLSAVGALGVLIAVANWALDPTHRFDTGVTGEVLVSADGRTVTAAAFWTGCETKPRLVAHESARGVTLAIRRTSHATKDMVCDDDSTGHATVALASPLGSRPLTDAVDGHPIVFLEGRGLANPQYLPAGYAIGDGVSPDVAGAVYEPPPGAPAPAPKPVAPAAWTRGYLDPRHDDLTITQTVGVLPRGQGTPVTVNGHPAYLQEWPSPEHADRREITWSDGSNTYDVASRAFGGGLSKDEFMRVAEGLR